MGAIAQPEYISDAARWDLIHKKTHRGDATHSVYAELVEKDLKRGSLIVDLGAGTGSDALYFLENGHSILLFDISSHALEIARERIKEKGYEKRAIPQVVDFGIHELPVKDNSVDVVYSRLSLHYFEKSHTIRIFKDIYRIIKPGGLVFLTFKSPEDVVEMEYLRNRASEFEENVFIENGQLRSRFTVEQLQSMLDLAGVTHYDVHPYVEEIVLHEDGNKGQLLLNEVRFTK